MFKEDSFKLQKILLSIQNNVKLKQVALWISELYP